MAAFFSSVRKIIWVFSSRVTNFKSLNNHSFMDDSLDQGGTFNILLDHTVH